jgi:hypothetical protein
VEKFLHVWRGLVGVEERREGRGKDLWCVVVVELYYDCALEAALASAR